MDPHFNHARAGVSWVYGHLHAYTSATPQTEAVAMPPPLAGAPGAAGSGQELTVPQVGPGICLGTSMRALFDLI